MGLSDCIFEPSDQDYDYVDSWFDFEYHSDARKLDEVLRVWSISSSTMPKRTNSSSSCKRLECSRQSL